MSSKPRITTQTTAAKRGRPRKYPIDTDKLLKQQERRLLRLQQQLEEQKRKLHQKEIYSLENKPREECSYKDFYPDLDIREPLSVVLKSPSPVETEKPKDSDPLKSPVSDECEAALESEDVTKDTSLTSSQHSKLPVPSFRKNTPDIENDELSVFQRPENHYIRYTEPSESQLFNTVEYDMDEQDNMWLLIINTERKKENLGELDADLFEKIIDQLEKQWFDLVKNLPKRISEEPAFPEDSKCAICDDGECENSNAIVFCDGCNLAVHQDCYGVPYIPEGQWLCRKCMVSPDKPVSCLFCPTEGGAFKQTTTNQWGHLLCAIWIPEVSLGNSVYMEPIDNISSVPKSRWKLTCYICRRRQGACIQCDNKHCFTAFHVTCARWARLYMKMKPPTSHSDDVALKAYCDKHTPKEYKEKIDVDKSIIAAQKWFSNPKNKKGQKMPHRRYVDEELDFDNNDSGTENKDKKKKRSRQDSVTQLLSTSKAARAHQHQYSAGAPVAPNYIIRNLENLKCIREANLQKKSTLIKSVCRYWSLKRESKRGAPLLKRLHLEPWTASASQLKESEVETAQKASSLMSLRSDLEKVRILTEQVQKREKQKLERARKQKAYLELIVLPLEHVIGPVLSQISDLDKNDIFRYPVTEDIAPDYLTIVKEPISFSEISDKIELHKYINFSEFEHDILLIWKNCMTYNKSDTTYYKLAQRLKRASVELMKKAKVAYDALNADPESGFLDVELDPEMFSYGNELKNSVQTEQTEKSEQIENAEHPEQTEHAEQTEQTEQTKQSEETEKNKRTITSTTLSKDDKSETIENVSDQQSDKEKINDGKNVPDVNNVNALLPKPTSSAKSRSPAKRKITTKDITEPSKKSKVLSSLVDELPDHLKTLDASKSSSIRRFTRSKAEQSKRLLRSRYTPRNVPEKKTKQPIVLRRKSAEITKSPSTEANEQSAPTTLVNKNISPKPQYKDKEIVWARVPGFPAHPAEIVEAKKQKDIPRKVLASEVKGRILVKFFSVKESHTWGWIDKSSITPFGIMNTDIMMLVKAKKTKNRKRINEVKEGYHHACKLKHLDPLTSLDEVFQK